MPTMRFAVGMDDAATARVAAEAAARQVTLGLSGSSCHLALVFTSPIYRADWTELLAFVHQQLAPHVLIGCSGSGIIGAGQELEWVPALSIVGAHLPDVELHPFVLSPDELELAGPGGFWIDKIGASPEAEPLFLLFADPFTCDPLKLITELNSTYRSRPILGGLVSGGNAAGEHLLFLQREVYHEGAVGLAMTGNIVMDTVIAQGCRPIGHSYIITKAEENIVWQLGGKQALVALHDVLTGLTGEDRQLAQRGSVFVGLAMTEMRQAFRAGDFLVRNIVGIDPETGAIAVADQVEVGRTLQFHLRDPRASRQELRRLLLQLAQSPRTCPPAGGVLLSCTGRGKALYGAAHQDVKTIHLVSGHLPIGGFFCNGEIGPVGEANWLHSYTAALGLFRPRA